VCVWVPRLACGCRACSQSDTALLAITLAEKAVTTLSDVQAAPSEKVEEDAEDAEDDAETAGGRATPASG
jgi:hypothetical protein